MAFLQQIKFKKSTWKPVGKPNAALLPLLRVCGLCSECCDCPQEGIVPWIPFCPITGDSSLFFRVLRREWRRKHTNITSCPMCVLSLYQPRESLSKTKKAPIVQCHTAWVTAVAGGRVVWGGAAEAVQKKSQINLSGLMDFPYFYSSQNGKRAWRSQRNQFIRRLTALSGWGVNGI